MELRHLRCFLSLLQKSFISLERQSTCTLNNHPLSRTIKELEYDLKVQLFERTTRSTTLEVLILTSTDETVPP